MGGIVYELEGEDFGEGEQVFEGGREE